MNGHSRRDDGSRTDISKLPDADVSSESRVRKYVATPFEVVVMVNRGRRVHADIVLDDRARVDRSSRQNCHALAQSYEA